MKLELKRISLWATTKVSFFLNLAVGFIFGCFYAPFIALIINSPFSNLPEGELDQIRGISGAVLIILPFMMAIFFAIFNTIFAFIGVAIYNLIAKMVGGLEFEYAEVPSPAVTPAPPVPPAVVAPAIPVQPAPPKQPEEPPQDFQL